VRIVLKRTISTDDLGEQRCVIKDSYLSLSFLRRFSESALEAEEQNTREKPA
jgi:hypothetical protein